MLVNRGENFLIRAHLHAAVDHRQAFGGAAGQGDLRRFGLQILAGPVAHVFFALLGDAQIPIHRQTRIQIQRRAMALDRFAHRFRMRGDEEIGEVNRLRILIEHLTQLRPFVSRRSGHGSDGRRSTQAGAQGQGGGEQAGLLEKSATIGHGRATSWRAASAGFAAFCT